MKKSLNRFFLLLLSVLYILSSLGTLTVFGADTGDAAAPPCSQCQEGDTDLLPYLPTRGNSDDYRAWAQNDSRWGSIPLGSSGCTVASHGCLVTSVTKLIIQCGLRSKDNFDVGVLTRWLNNNSGFTSDGGLYWGKPSACVSGFTNYGNLLEWGTYSSSSYNDRIISWIKSGYHLALNVNGGGHWVAVDEAKSLATGKVYIMDSAPGSADIALTNRYSTFNVVHAYKGGTTPSANEPSMTLSGLSFPDTIKAGSTPELSGKISANCSITWVWAGIDVRGTYTHLQQVQCNPMDLSFDIASLLKGLNFADLAKGDYTLRIDAIGGDQYFVLYTKDFRVDDLYMNLSGASIPTSISVGDSFSPSGKITSNSIITWVWTGVLESGTNKHMTEAQCNPMDYSYNIYTLTKTLNISSLPAGEYVYRIEAISGDKYYVLFAENFKVVDNPCKNGHNYNYSISKTPTTSADGKLTGTCSRCNGTTSVTLPKLNTTDYSYSVVKAASCTATGTGRYTWKNTNYGTFRFDVTIAKTSHSYTATVTAPTCTEMGYTTNACVFCGETYVSDYVAPQGHDFVNHSAKNATCTESGWYAYRTCSRCDYSSYAEIPVLGHDLIDHAAKAATDTESGWEAYQTCSRCDYTTYKEIPPKGHIWSAPIRENEIAPSCTEKGSYDETVYCADCRAELSRKTNEIPALGHDWGAAAYEWAGDYSAITARRVCKRDGNHAEAEAGVIVKTVREATYDSEGEIVYTATFRNAAFAGQSKTVKTPKLTRPSTAGNPFTDVKNGTYYYEAVLWAVEKGITAGTSTTTFSPDDTCTRAQIVTFLWRYEGQPAPTTANNPFADVKESAYFAKAVLWAAESGVTSGTSATTFSPKDTCTRAQVVTFLYRDITNK